MGGRIIYEANLPKGTVKTVFLGDKYIGKLEKGLLQLGISTIGVPKNPFVPEAVAFHADMSICHLGFDTLVVAAGVYDELKKRVPQTLRLIKAASPQRAEYPHDIGLNACLIGDRLLHNLKYTDESIIGFARENRLRSYNVKQGYTKCSVCVLTRNRIITADVGIHRACEELGIESLLIQGGSIILDGYDTGFIGGCCGKISADKIAFSGRLKGLKDEKKILNFIWDSGIDVVYLTDEPVFDVGSIIPIEEYPNA